MPTVQVSCLRCLSWGGISVGVALVMILNFATLSSSHAATFAVDHTDDDPAASACDDAMPKDCSLRGAIIKANASTAASTIVVPAGLYVLSQGADCVFMTTQFGTGFIANATSLCLSSAITLVGAGAASTIIDANQPPINSVGTPVMFVGSNATVEIRGVTITKGNFTVGSLQGHGGAINNAGILTLVDCVLRENIAIDGGAIYNSNTLTVLRSTISHNSASGDGGGIFNDSRSVRTVVAVADSVVTANHASANGGGIMNFQGIVIISGSTISRNAAEMGGGGGIASLGGPALPAMVTATNTTVSDNRAGRTGGGMLNLAFSTLLLQNATVVVNRADIMPGGVGNTDGSTVEMQNSILARNVVGASGPSDCFGVIPRGSALTSRGYNLIQTTSNCDIIGDTTGNVVALDPNLGVLTDNGGPTPTHALNAGSPAIDAGSPAPAGMRGTACAALDQRGFARPLGAACDIGAFERSGDFSLSTISPSTGGRTASVSALVSGNGFVNGTTIRLTRPEQPDIVGEPLRVDAGGSAIAVTFDLAGRPRGAWDVVAVNPDSESRTLVGGFTIADPEAPKLWVDVTGLVRRPGRPSQLTISYGNRGNVDAVGVPLSLSIPGSSSLSALFHIAPPPPQPGQVRSDWSQVSAVVQTDTLGSFIHVPLLLPLVPAGFTGMLQIQLVLPLDAQDSLLLATIGDPFFSPGLDPQVVTQAVAGVQAYLQRHGGITVPSPVLPTLAQYVRNQLQQVVSDGRSAFLASLGTQPQVYSVAQLHLDAALFGAARAAAGGGISPAPAVRRPALLSAPRRLVALTQRWLAALVTWLGPSEAHAQEQNCPPAQKGQALAPGCSGSGGLENIWPPALPPPPGCNLKDPTTFRECVPTRDQCEALPKHEVVTASDGTQFCVPEKRPPHCPRIPIGNPLLGSANIDCKSYPLKPKSAFDPNDKSGSVGAAEAHFLPLGTPLTYTVHFENVPTATAPAQVVLVTDQLNPDTVDLDTFRLGPITFGDVTLNPAPGVQAFTGGVDLRPTQNIVVTVHAGLDKQTGVVTWRLTSIDPDTGQLTEDPDAGFLPPNTTPPVGEGSVVFTVMPARRLATGTEIRNQATIVFDINPPISTPTWVNTVDNDAPLSKVLPLSPTQTSSVFTVQWQATDAGSGVQDATLFVSENGGPFRPVVEDVASTAVTFVGQAGKTYSFFSVARDLVGNVESKRPVAEASTRVAGVSVTGDVNGDGVINCTDLGIIKASFGKRTGKAGFDERADVNRDGIVNVRDLAFVARRLPATMSCP